VQSAERRDHVLAGALVEVIGVGEGDASPRVAQLPGVHAPHGAVGGDGHEGRRLDLPVGRQQDAGARLAVAGGHGEAEALSAHWMSIASP
jgi:hypothetical protein